MKATASFIISFRPQFIASNCRSPHSAQRWAPRWADKISPASSLLYSREYWYNSPFLSSIISWLWYPAVSVLVFHIGWWSPVYSYSPKVPLEPNLPEIHLVRWTYIREDGRWDRVFTYRKSQSAMRDNAQEELDWDAPASDQPREQITMTAVQDQLDSMDASKIAAFQDIFQHLVSLSTDFCDNMAQCHGSFAPPLLEYWCSLLCSKRKIKFW